MADSGQPALRGWGVFVGGCGLGRPGWSWRSEALLSASDGALLLELFEELFLT